MSTFELITREGETRTIEARDGLSVMEAIKRTGVYELEAVCGGSCSCATCHVYIDGRFVDVAAPMSEVEADLLDTSDHRTPRSRLACQISLSASLEGMTVKIAPKD